MIRSAALALSSLALVAACQPMTPAGPAQTTGSVNGIPLGPYYLVSLGAEAVPQRDATLVLTSAGFSGRGPCNTFSGNVQGEYPSFRVAEMTWTDLACPGSDFESRYFQALTQATDVVWEGGVLQIRGATYMQLEPGIPGGPLSRLGR
ncbi:META domain-containing protein [Paracoccus sp. TK19116]|uniref:META domain-containing protein n=1 Tax=Paracoccus albicereus TaxID=2922394 RepID=A0ABT1MSL3_9RHOB|nr:META domain-containing protein [Paracoccus albicereus]MCQ0971305.1 META domain-containing protein [Paracoccus albicereus]